MRATKMIVGLAALGLMAAGFAGLSATAAGPGVMTWQDLDDGGRLPSGRRVVDVLVNVNPFREDKGGYLVLGEIILGGDADHDRGCRLREVRMIWRDENGEIVWEGAPIVVSLDPALDQVAVVDALEHRHFGRIAQAIENQKDPYGPGGYGLQIR